MLTATAIDRTALIDWYRRNRARSSALFDLTDPTAYYTRPISLRNPIVFYEGHLPAFGALAFLRRGLGLPPIDARLEKLFERGIDPDSEAAAVPRSGASTIWPSRDEVGAFASACDDAMLEAIAGFTPTAEAIEGLYTALEHEAMHQETLLYMFHRLPYDLKSRLRSVVRDPQSVFESVSGERGQKGSGLQPTPGARSLDRARGQVSGYQTPASEWRPGPSVTVAGGPAVLGADRSVVAFGWDNEFDQHTVHVPPFDVDVLPVTNAQFLEFVNAGGYGKRDLWDHEGWEWVHANRIHHPAFWLPGPKDTDTDTDTETDRDLGTWRWRGMFSPAPFPVDAPVYVSQAEAAAYARWKGRRLMTEAEWHRAAEGATAGHADFAGYDPIAVGSRPATASVHGVHDLIGNGWEWTSTVFGPFAGFSPMRSYPEYSADFFDGRHYVMKGASPATARELIRPSFRNWFRGDYPYVYAKFRTVGR